jgi:hypothetical protein
MNEKQLLPLLLLSAALIVSPGCDRDPATGKRTPKYWLGIPSAVETVIKVVHEGTGWILGKMNVTVVAEEVRSAGNGFVADMKITVTNGDNTFSTTAKDVPCDARGIPTAASVDVLRGAAEDIKSKIKRIQS